MGAGEGGGARGGSGGGATFLVHSNIYIIFQFTTITGNKLVFMPVTCTCL